MLVGGFDLERLRPRLLGLAYRMLGSRDEAEDAVQEALLRWHQAETAEIRSPEAWLVTVLSRLCVDRLRALATQRESYIGPWLPEPIVGDADRPDRRIELASDLSMALLIVLERLAPEERAAFLLHDVFDSPYPEIARALGKSEAACRQIVHRARERVRRDKPRFAVSAAAHRNLIQNYIAAVQAGDVDRIVSLLAPDAVLVSDGGGKVWAARKPIIGADRIARLEIGVLRKRAGVFAFRILPINGQPGLVFYRDGSPAAATAFETDGERILSVFRVLNPDKLRSLPPLDEGADRPQ